MDDHEDTPVVEVDVFVAHDAQLLPGAGPLAPALCHSGQPRPATGCGGVGSHKLDLGVCPLNRVKTPARQSCDRFEPREYDGIGNKVDGDQADPSEPSTARIALCPLKIDASRPARVGTWVAASTGSLRRRPARRSRRCSGRLRAREPPTPTPARSTHGRRELRTWRGGGVQSSFDPKGAPHRRPPGVTVDIALVAVTGASPVSIADAAAAAPPARANAQAIFCAPSRIATASCTAVRSESGLSASGGRHVPAPSAATRAPTSNWSRPNGMMQSGTPEASVFCVMPMPPWQRTTAAWRSSAPCGSHRSRRALAGAANAPGSWAAVLTAIPTGS